MVGVLNETEVSESDSLLFNPCEDEQNQIWVMKTLLASHEDKEYQQLSCASCFTPLAFMQSAETALVKTLKQKFKANYAS